MKISKVLKYGAIILFVLSLMGAIGASNKEEVELKEATYSWEDDEYEKVTSFDAMTFFSLSITAAISCTLIYAFGELIGIEDEKRRYLIARFGEPKTVADDNVMGNQLNQNTDVIN